MHSGRYRTVTHIKLIQKNPPPYKDRRYVAQRTCGEVPIKNSSSLLRYAIRYSMYDTVRRHHPDKGERHR